MYYAICVLSIIFLSQYNIINIKGLLWNKENFFHKNISQDLIMITILDSFSKIILYTKKMYKNKSLVLNIKV